MFVREMKLADLPSLLEIWEPEHMSMCRKRFQVTLERNPGTCLVGIEDDQIVATCMGEWDGHRGILGKVVVHQGYRGHGYGEQIVQETIRALNEVGCDRIRLFVLNDNLEVLPFYEKMGFVKREIVYMALSDAEPLASVEEVC